MDLLSIMSCGFILSGGGYGIPQVMSFGFLSTLDEIALSKAGWNGLGPWGALPWDAQGYWGRNQPWS